MELSDDDARQQAAELIAAADEIMSRPGPHAEIAARLQSAWEAITAGEDARPERERAARARAANILRRADETVAEPRPDAVESDRQWRELEEGRRAREDERQWLASRERKDQPQRRRSSAAMTRADFDGYLNAIIEATAKFVVTEIKAERAKWQEQVAKLEIRLDALAQGAEHGE